MTGATLVVQMNAKNISNKIPLVCCKE